MCEIFLGTHSVHLSSVMQQAELSDPDSESIRNLCNDLLRFLSGNVHNFFLNEYEQPPLDYMKENGQ